MLHYIGKFKLSHICPGDTLRLTFTAVYDGCSELELKEIEPVTLDFMVDSFTYSPGFNRTIEGRVENQPATLHYCDSEGESHLIIFESPA